MKNNLCYSGKLPCRKLHKDDSLKQIFRAQANLQRVIRKHKPNTPDFTRPDKMSLPRLVYWTKDLLLCLVAEAIETLEWIPWKHWKKKTKPNVNELAYELVDMLHFWINLCFLWGLKPEDVLAIYMDKNRQNMERQKKGY